MKSGFVSFIGRPNAGKSTLLNRMVGTKLAIVSDKPQTTRTRILGVRNYPDAQVVFLDTPGIHRPLHRMNVRMVDTAVDTIGEVDVLGLVVDVAEPPGKGDRFVLDLVKKAKSPVFLILNKIDLIKKSKLLPIIDRYWQERSFAEIVPVSAATKLAQEAFGPAVDAHRLVRLAAEGDATAVEILDGIGRKLGAAIGSFVNVFRPQIVVIGGGFASAGDFLLEPAREIMRREALPPANDRVEIVRAELGTAAGVIGAALVASDELT